MATGLLTAVSAQFATSPISTAAIAFLSASIVFAIAAGSFFFGRLIRDRRAQVSAQSERQKSDKLRQQSERYDVALNYMSQGLVMFDVSERVVLCNRRYLEISGLSAEFMQAGRTLREILQARQARGTFSGDIEEYRRELLNDIASGKTKSLIIESIEGRFSRVANVPMAGGGVDRYS